MEKLSKDTHHIHYKRTNALFLRSLFKMAPQIFLASFSVFLVSVVDGIVVGNAEGSDAIAAVTAMSPFLTIVGMAVAVVHSGVSVTLPQLMGTGDREKEFGGYRATSVVTLVVAAVIAVAQIPVAFLVISSMGFSPETAREAWAYSFGLFIANPLDCISTVGSHVLISMGSADCILLLSLVEGFVNLGADILLVFGFDLGTLGAGFGTAIAIAVRCALTLVLIRKKTKFFEFGKQSCKKPALEIVRLGIPDGFNVGIHAIFAWAISWLIMDALGVEGMTVKTVIGFASSMASILLSSITKSARTIIGFRKGLNDYRGVFLCFKATAGCVIALTLLLACLFCLFPKVPYGFYGVQEIPSYGVFALRVFAASLVFSGLNSLASYYYILNERIKLASALNFLEGLLVPAAAILFALLVLGSEYIWICYLLSSFGVFIINLILLNRMVVRDWKAGQSVRSLSLSVTKEQASDLSKRVHDTAQDWGLSGRDAYRLSLVIEEVGSYAKGRRSDKNLKIDVVITATGDCITIALIDNGDEIKELDEEHLESRSKAGYSNYDVLKDVVETISYQRFINNNVITITI